MKFKFDRSTFSTFFILILISLFVNIYTFTSLAPLYKYLISGELFTDFNRVFTHDDYLYLMRFIVYFVSGAFTGIVVYITYMELLLQNIKQINRFFIIWSVVAFLAFLAYLFHLSFLEIPNYNISYSNYKFNRAMWYIGRGLSLGVIAIYIANFKFNKQIEEQKQRKIHDLKIENLKSQFYILKNQLNPRFLFTSIDTLNELIGNKPKAAQSFVIELSKLLRYSISEKVMNNIEKEIEIAKSFAFIMKYKYQKQIQFDFETETAPLNSYLPSFSLQIALEHMIHVCENPNNKKFKIRIESTIDNCITVSCKPQSMLSIVEVKGMALNNLSQHYQIITGNRLEMTSENKLLEIKLPLLGNSYE